MSHGELGHGELGHTAPDPADQPRGTPALRRTLMRVRPECFGWPSSERDRYRVNIPDRDAAEIGRLLQEELFSFANTETDLDAAQLERFNAAILPLRGIG